LLARKQARKKGMPTGADFSRLMNALTADLRSGAITPEVAQAVLGTGRITLKVVELSYKYGTKTETSNIPTLILR
jgi:hypothetical protein